MPVPDKAYPIPVATVEAEEVIKKSRFLSIAAHTRGREEAKNFIDKIRAEHPDARHHCWAFIAGRPDDAQMWGFSDDGEPSGTAGKPILARLQGSGIGELCVVVVRYYGGIKLGTGGLVRAYGSGAGQAVDLIQTRLRVPESLASLTCDYDQLPDVEYFLAQFEGRIVDIDYGAQLNINLSLPDHTLTAFSDALTSRFRGMLSLQRDK